LLLFAVEILLPMEEKLHAFWHLQAFEGIDSQGNVARLTLYLRLDLPNTTYSVSRPGA
jgi:hypothetical protein